jgi:hypothetical protein
MATEAPKTPTTRGAGAFERYVANRRAASGEFDIEYRAAKTETLGLDAIINALDDAREESGLTNGFRRTAFSWLVSASSTRGVHNR